MKVLIKETVKKKSRWLDELACFRTNEPWKQIEKTVSFQFANKESMLRLTQKIFSSGTAREPSNGAATKKGGGTPQTKISPQTSKRQ